MLMWPLTALAVMIYAEGFRLIFSLRSHPMGRKVPVAGAIDADQKRWVEQMQFEGQLLEPGDPSGFDVLRSGLNNHFQRRATMLARFVKSGPLLGLLGTVMGMLGTFEGLLSTGLTQAEEMAAGISQALITTQYGLLVAIPGLILLSFVRTALQRLDRHLIALEIRWMRGEKDLLSSTVETTFESRLNLAVGSA